MEHYTGPIKPNRFIPPLDLQHRDQPPKRRFQDPNSQNPFEEMIKDELEEESELPPDIQNQIIRLKTHLTLALPQVRIIVNNLNQHAVKLLKEMAESTVAGSERPEGLDRLMGELITAFGLALTQYGSSEALNHIAHIWKSLDPSDTAYKKIHSLFQLIAMQKTLPLKGYAHTHPQTYERSVALKAQLAERLEHDFPDTQTRFIKTRFNYGVDPFKTSK